MPRSILYRSRSPNSPHGVCLRDIKKCLRGRYETWEIWGNIERDTCVSPPPSNLLSWAILSQGLAIVKESVLRLWGCLDYAGWVPACAKMAWERGNGPERIMDSSRRFTGRTIALHGRDAKYPMSAATGRRLAAHPDGARPGHGAVVLHDARVVPRIAPRRLGVLDQNLGEYAVALL